MAVCLIKKRAYRPACRRRDRVAVGGHSRLLNSGIIEQHNRHIQYIGRDGRHHACIDAARKGKYGRHAYSPFRRETFEITQRCIADVGPSRRRNRAVSDCPGRHRTYSQPSQNRAGHKNPADCRLPRRYRRGRSPACYLPAVAVPGSRAPGQCGNPWPPPLPHRPACVAPPGYAWYRPESQFYAPILHLRCYSLQRI